MVSTIGRLATASPMGFQAGDQNLYRFLGSSPTNATDPSGLFIVFNNKAEAQAFVDELKTKYKAQFASIVEGNTAFHVVIDPRDRDAVFGYADDHFSGIFIRGFVANTEAKEIAERRNEFLRAAGVMGLLDNVWTDVR